MSRQPQYDKTRYSGYGNKTTFLLLIVNYMFASAGFDTEYELS